MRKKIRKRIIIFSIGIAFGVLILAIGIFIIFGIVIPYHYEMKDNNDLTFENINYNENGYDVSRYVNFSTQRGSDYILTQKEKLFIWVSSDYPDFSLDYSDPNFIRNFRKPTDYNSPTGEKWRLYSLSETIDNKNYEIMVGWIEKSPERLVETPVSPEIDQKLEEEANTIAQKMEEGKIQDIRPSVDGYEIVDAETGRVSDWGWALPAFFPNSLPKSGYSFFRSGSEINLVRTDYAKGLIAVSINSVGNLWQLIGAAILIFFFIFLLSYLLSSTYLKKYFIFSIHKPILIDEALKTGEGQKIEFKRFLVDEDFLKTITSFANSNDGTIFLGIDDNGHIVGLSFKDLKERDIFKSRIFNLIRDKINPLPLVDFNFEDVRGFIVAKIFVPRGEDFLYYFNGISYVRRDSADIQPEPALIKKILTEHAF